MMHTIRLEPGDRLALTGGYDFEPQWLNNQSELLAIFRQFVPGQNLPPAALVELDQPITCEGITGRILILELRYVGATWQTSNIVHLELCDFEPEVKPWKDRRKGKWVEAAATCVIVSHVF
jgi:hypothetical protein